MKVGGKEYTLVQYHFHAPSEHAFDGIRLPLEAHFVHKSKEGEQPESRPQGARKLKGYMMNWSGVF